MSLVWKYFEKVDDAGEKKARCLDAASCKGKTQLIKCGDGNTTGLKNHMKSFHKEKYAEFCVLHEQRNQGKYKKSNKRKSDDPESAPLKQCKITTTVHNMIKYPDQHPVQLEFDSKLLDVIIEGFLSFGFANLSATKDLVNFLNKKITVKHSSTYSRQAEVKYKACMSELKTIISEMVGSSCAFTSDLWTSRVNDAYMSLTAHFIDSGFNLHHWTPYCRFLGAERHTGEVIGNHLEQMVKELDIDTVNVSLYGVTDNASNIRLGVRNGDVSSLTCNNHTLQLGIDDSFEVCDGMVKIQQKCKDIATLTHKSSVIEKTMHTYCVQHQHKPNKIHQENDTRWNSGYQNMKDVIHHQECINDMANDDKIDSNLVPTIREWKMIHGACEVLSLLVATTKEWEKEKVPTINLVTKELHDIHVTLKEFIDNKDNKMHGVVFARALMKALTKRFPKFGLTKSVNAFGNLLDPVIKGLHLLEENMFDDIIEKLEESASDLNLETNLPTQSEPTDTQDDMEVTLSPLEQLRLKHSRVPAPAIAQSAVKREIETYLSFPYCRVGDDILQWWKLHQESCPLLSQLARHYLAIPASSCKSERVFSCAGNVVTARRTRLSASKVEMLVVLKQNMNMLKDYKQTNVL